MPKIKNIIIFIVIAAIFVLIYIFFIKPGTSDTASLVSTSATSATGSTATSNPSPNPAVAQDFLNLLLNIQSIKLDVSIFSDNAFINISKHDTSIILTPDGTEGRPNPFAPLGADVVPAATPVCTLPQVLDTVKNICVTPPLVCTLPKILDKTTNTCITPPSH